MTLILKLDLDMVKMYAENEVPEHSYGPNRQTDPTEVITYQRMWVVKIVCQIWGDCYNCIHLSQ